MVIDTRIAVVGLSLTGALLLACAGVLVKAGLRYSDVRQSVLVSFGANALVAAVAAQKCLQDTVDEHNAKGWWQRKVRFVDEPAVRKVA